MLSNIGIISIIITLFLSFSVIYISILSLKEKDNLINKKIYNYALYQVIFSILSFLTLLAAFINSDFSLINVFENSHVDKPYFIK